MPRRRDGNAGGASLDLFDDPLWLRWLPGETLYSVAARYSILSGIVDPSRVSIALFGYRRGGFPHALPGGIRHFAGVFKTVFGPARKIIVSRTIAPQLVVARTPSVREATYAAMEGARVETLKARLGLLASGFGGALPLKACPVCVDEDERIKGFSYWRVSHQLPGTWSCPHHGVLLQISMAMRSGQARYSWVLPKREDLISPLQNSCEPAEAATRCLARLAAASQWLLTIGRRGGLDLARLSTLLWDRLSAEDLAHHGRRLRPARAAESFFRFFCAVHAISELERVASTPSIAYSQLLAVLNGRAEGFHPVRIASVVAWLFPSNQAFLRLYRRPRVVAAKADVRRSAAPPPGSSTERAEFLRLIEAGRSISASAQVVGITVATGQAWAASAGVAVPRRASLIRDHIRNQMVDALRRGADKKQVATEFEVSASSVGRILRTEAGLHADWMLARFNARRCFARIAWMRALAGASGRTKIARALQPAVYAWLYRNDDAWLRDAKPAHDQRRPNNTTVDWQQRDEQLRIEILRAVEAIRATGPKQVRLLDLLTRLPTLKRNLRNLHHLPLTDQALDQMVTHRRRRHEPDLFQ